MQVFGHIDGVSEGQTFNTRLEVKEAGLHKHHIGGISRILGVGCDCIVLSGGYSDDIDNGDIIFTPVKVEEKEILESKHLISLLKEET